MKAGKFLLIVSVVTGIGCSQESRPEDSEVDKDVIAIVLGKQLRVKDSDELRGLILGALLKQFAEDNSIEPTAEEIDVFVLKAQERTKQDQARMEEDRLKLVQELKNSDLSDEEREQRQSHLRTIESVLNETRAMDEQANGMDEQMRAMERQMARQFVLGWKMNKALYDKYGGRVAFQQFGPEPLDAYRKLLLEKEKKGSFEILDKQYEAEFWRYFTDDAMHTFYAEDDGAKFINTPWWMMEESPGE